MPSGNRSGPVPTIAGPRNLMIRRSVRVGVWWGFGAVVNCDRLCRPYPARNSGPPACDSGDRPCPGPFDRGPISDAWGVTVGHKDLRGRGAFLDSSRSTRRSSSCHQHHAIVTSVVSAASRPSSRSSSPRNSIVSARSLYRPTYLADLIGPGVECSAMQIATRSASARVSSDAGGGRPPSLPDIPTSGAHRRQWTHGAPFPTTGTWSDQARRCQREPSTGRCLLGNENRAYPHSMGM